MTVRVHCPNPDCGKGYKVDKGRLGRRTTCERCGREFTLSVSERETLQPDAQTGTTDEAPASPGVDIPAKLGRFEIRCRVGAGAFATVYRAYDPVLDREVALKVPRAAALEKPEAMARFLREAKAAAQLRHPHIVPVYDAGSDGEEHYIASAYVEGRTLEEVIDDKRPELRRAAGIIRDLADALDYAHRVGVIHRDVKPANIMIDRRGEAMLTDFGLARLEGSEEKLTQDGTLMGTLAYMAPEQASSSSGEVGPASDQYGLAVVLYELLCGRPPFSGPAAALIYNALHEAPDAPRSIDSAVPRDLETICLKAMAKRPEDRYADCGELAEDLRLSLADEPIRARRIGPAERLARWCRRNPLVATLLAAVVLVTALGLAGATWQWRRAEVNRGLAEGRRKEAEGLVGQLQEKIRENEILIIELDSKGKEAQELARQRKEALYEAEKERTRAQGAEKAARAAEAEAKKNQAEADRRRVEAEEARDAEKREREKAQRHLYAMHVNLAMQAFYAMNMDRVRELVSRQTDEDLRSFEWYYFSRKLGLPQPAGYQKGELEQHLERVEQSRQRAGHDRTPSLMLASHPRGLESLAVSRGGLLATASGRGIAIQYIVDDLKEPFPGETLKDTLGGSTRHREAHTGRVRGLTFWRGRPVSASEDGSIKIWGGHNAPLATLGAHTGAVYAVAVSPDGDTLASGSEDKSVLLWVAGELLPGRPKGTRLKAPLMGHRAGVRCVAFSSDGKNLASGDAQGVIILWDLRSHGPRAVVKGHSDGVLCLQFSPDGGTLASGSKDGTIKLWDLTDPRQDPRERATLRGHGGPVNCMAFSPDGKTLASGSDDSTITLWDPALGLQRMTLSGHAGEVRSVVFWHTGMLLISGSSTGAIRVW